MILNNLRKSVIDPAAGCRNQGHEHQGGEAPHRAIGARTSLAPGPGLMTGGREDFLVRPVTWIVSPLLRGHAMCPSIAIVAAFQVLASGSR